MPTSQQNINNATAMGANLTAGGATFRLWAPRADEVFISGSFNAWARGESERLVRDGSGYWAGFVSNVADGDEYKFYVVGRGSRGYKRDPYARELTAQPAYPLCNCVVRDPASYPWHDAGFAPPAFNDLVIYQLHVGTFFGPDRQNTVATFLDVLDRLDYLVELGVNAIEPLPVVEYASPRSMGYDGSDLFSPEMDYQVPAVGLAPALAKVNALLQRRGAAALTLAQLSIPSNQLKAMVDVCHLYGMAVIFDVVYNHAGGQIAGQDESLYFLDRAAGADPNDSLYFTRENHTGPVFALWRREVRQFLIDNARFWVREYHADGLRYDQASVLVAQNQNDGWQFCQDVTSSVRAADGSVLQAAEYWPVDPWVTKDAAQGGAGFDAAWHDGLRMGIREAIGQASRGAGAQVDMERIAQAMRGLKADYAAGWKTVGCVESHDEVYRGRGKRLPALGDGVDSRSWYARSRARVATGLLLTCPGIPLLFMGQEFLEHKPWGDNPQTDGDVLIDWSALSGSGGNSKAMADHLRFTRELVALRRRHPALRGEGLGIGHVHNLNRVLAFHRWQEGAGHDVVVVASLNESTFFGYELGFPGAGHWREVFNSDVYDNWVNPQAAGNGGGVTADGPPRHGLSASSSVVVPANSILVFARDVGG